MLVLVASVGPSSVKGALELRPSLGGVVEKVEKKKHPVHLCIENIASYHLTAYGSCSLPLLLQELGIIRPREPIAPLRAPVLGHSPVDLAAEDGAFAK